MKVAISSDHGGYSLKEYLIMNLKDEYDLIDLGCYSNESVDYPIYASKVAVKVQEKEANLGIVICTNGIGASIVANKYKGIRCALSLNISMATNARLHNDCNLIALGAINQSKEDALEIVKAFLNNNFSNEERHLRRINEIIKIEENI